MERWLSPSTSSTTTVHGLKLADLLQHFRCVWRLRGMQLTKQRQGLLRALAHGTLLRRASSLPPERVASLVELNVRLEPRLFNVALPLTSPLLLVEPFMLALRS